MMDRLQLPELVLGGTALNYQYNDEPETVPIEAILRRAFAAGVRAIDTSPYYGPSEELYGRALAALRDEFPRDGYLICTKVGREAEPTGTTTANGGGGASGGDNTLAHFDYSPQHVRYSVNRSLKRLNTDYLDLVYLHDVEFMPLSATVAALQTLSQLKREGTIRFFGISGYPLDYLASVLAHVDRHHAADIGPLDAVLSYCHLTLQNDALLAARPTWPAHLVVANGSVLSMSLLRDEAVRPFHPGSAELRRRAARAAAECRSRGVALADLATRFSLAQWFGRGPTVLGVSSVAELESALQNYAAVREGAGRLGAADRELVEVVRGVFGDLVGATWASGIPH